MIITAHFEGLKEIERGLRELGADAPKALSRSIRETMNRARTIATRDIREKYDIKYGVVQSQLTSKVVGSTEGLLVAKNPMVPMMTYPTSPRVPQPEAHKQIKVNIIKGKTADVGKAFIADMPNGHRGVFVRLGKKRLKIKELMSIGAAQEMLANRMNERIPDELAEYYLERLEHQIFFLLGK